MLYKMSEIPISCYSFCFDYPPSQICFSKICIFAIQIFFYVASLIVFWVWFGCSTSQIVFQKMSIFTIGIFSSIWRSFNEMIPMRLRRKECQISRFSGVILFLFWQSVFFLQKTDIFTMGFLHLWGIHDWKAWNF